MIFAVDVDPVDLDDTVAEEEAGRVGRRLRVQFADEMTFFLLVGQQMETETLAISPFDDVAQTWPCSNRKNFLHLLLLFLLLLLLFLSLNE